MPCMFNLGRIFASAKWNDQSYTDAKKNKNKTKQTKATKTCYPTYNASKAVSNNKSKLKQICVLTMLKWASEMTET